MVPAGYSKTPLVRKLGINKGFKVVLHNPPMYYFNLFEKWPDEVEILKVKGPGQVDFLHLFYTRMSELERTFPDYQVALKKNGLIWISWPKGASKIETDLNRDLIRDYVLKTTGLVDVKVAAIDRDWSGLKFVYRLENR